MVETEAAAAVTVTVTAGYIRSPTAAERARGVRATCRGPGQTLREQCSVYECNFEVIM